MIQNAIDKSEGIRYRHEWKHEITYADLIAIRQRLRAVADVNFTNHPAGIDDTAIVKAQGGAGVVMVEEFIPGREFTVGVIDGEPLPVLEIVAPNGWYGYHEKYDSNETRYPFLEDGELAKKMQKIAVDAYKAIGCRGVTRVDFRVSPLGRCYVLELNTSPGFTSHSLVPKAGMKTGLTFAGVCDRILASAKHD